MDGLSPARKFSPNGIHERIKLNHIYRKFYKGTRRERSKLLNGDRHQHCQTNTSSMRACYSARTVWKVQKKQSFDPTVTPVSAKKIQFHRLNEDGTDWLRIKWTYWTHNITTPYWSRRFFGEKRWLQRCDPASRGNNLLTRSTGWLWLCAYFIYRRTPR